MIFTAKIEQTYAYPKRMKYIAEAIPLLKKNATVFRMCAERVSHTAG